MGMRRTPWSWAFLIRVLMESRRTMADRCSTAWVDIPNQTWTFDQCDWGSANQAMQIGVGDQCVVTCLTLADLNLFHHYALIGADVHPEYQHTLNVGQGNLVDNSWNPGQFFVVNCAGHRSPEELYSCVGNLTKSAMDGYKLAP